MAQPLYMLQATKADLDIERVEAAGIAASQRCLARIRSGFMRTYASRGHYQFSAQAELLNHMVPVMSKTLALSYLMGQRRATLCWQESGLDPIALSGYDPNEPRDDLGQWTTDGKLSSPAFKKWFGDSKVVDDQGRPLVVYHGTHAKFTEFENHGGPMFFGTESKAKDFAGDNGHVMPVFLAIKNPVKLPWVGTLGLYANDIREYKKQGHDGAQMRDGVWVAFEPNQIKSATGNRGTFSPDDADIRMAFGITSGLCLDRFSEVMKAIRATGLGRDLTRVQRGYARRVYQLMRESGAKIDATTRATVANLIASNEPIGRGVQILQATLNKLGVGDHSQAQLETIYRTETARAYHSGRRQMDLRRWGDIWGFRYVTMRDDRVRPTHASWEGTVLKKGNRFWKTHWPPCGWNCRCQIVTIYKTPGYKPHEVPPGKINGQVARADDGFGDNWDASVALSLASV